MSQWQDKVVLITGGSSGLGLALTRAFAGQQARVFIVGRNSDRLQQAASSVPEAITAIAADITSDYDVTRVFDQIQADALFVQIIDNRFQCREIEHIL